jgi:lysophospholipase L1-like esterase
MKCKNLIFGLICFVIFPLFLLSITELGLKVIGYQSLYQEKFEAKSKTHFRDNHSLYIIDKDLLWSLQPNSLKIVDGYSYQINSHGMRSPEFSIEKHPGVYRIAIFGDSSSFGLNLPYQEIYHQYLLRELEKKYPDKKFEVINFGVPGYSSKQGLVTFYKWASRIKPDLAILNFGANDGYSVPAGYMSDMDIIGLSTTWAVYFRSQVERSRLASMMSNIVDKFKSNSNEVKKDAKWDFDVRKRVSPNDYEGNIKTISSMAKKLRFPAIFLNISVADDYYNVLKKLTDSKEIIFCDIEVLLQDIYYSRDRDKFLSQFTTNQMKTPIIPEIDGMCTRLLGERQMKIRRDRLLFTDDFHPNAPGNYIIAEALFKRIEQLNLIR